MKLIKYILLFLFLFTISIGYCQTDEYTVKAIFIEKLTRFIDWPSNSKVNDKSKPIIMSVIGENPFGNRLNEIYKSNIIKGKKVRIQYITNIAEIEGSDILFISNSEKDYLPDIIAYTKDKPILTIGDYDEYADNGVLINFYMQDNKIRFEMNETAFSLTGLHSSFLLLNLAKIVKPVK